MSRQFSGRRVLFAIAVVSIFVSLSSPMLGQDAPMKIAVVDLELIVASSQSGKDLQQSLEDFQAAIQTEGIALADVAQALRKRIADGANTLSEEKLTDLQKEYEDATIMIRRFQDDKNREGQKMQAEGLRVIESKLQPVFEALREENGYDIILNNVPGVVVMSSKRVDITKMVIARLNAADPGSDG